MAENELQYNALTDTVHAIRFHYRHRQDVYVAGDMLIYYRMNRSDLSVAPGVYVVFGADGSRPRDSWLVWREGKAPDFVLEIASPSTWRRDAGDKRDIYASIGVTEYWRFDPTGGTFFTPTLVGERLEPEGYRRLPSTTDADAVLRSHSAVLELDFCVRADGQLRLYDPASGQWLRTPREDGEGREALQIALRESEAARQSVEAENARLREQLLRLQQQQ